MQQIFEVKDTAAHNQKASQCCTCWKGDTVCCSLCRGLLPSWDNPHGSRTADFPSSLRALAWNKGAGVF